MTVGPEAKHIPNKKLKCSSCQGAPSASRPWCTQRLDDGTIVNVGCACKRCYRAWHDVIRHNPDLSTWESFCPQRASKPGVAKAHESVMSLQDKLGCVDDDRDYPVGEVRVVDSFEVRAKSSGRLIRDANFGKAVGIEDMTPRDAKIQQDSVHLVGKNTSVKGVCVLDVDPDLEDIPIDIIHGKRVEKITYPMRQNQHLKKETLDMVFNAERKKQIKKAPKALRGYAKQTFTLAQLKKHCAALRDLSHGSGSRAKESESNVEPQLALLDGDADGEADSASAPEATPKSRRQSESVKSGGASEQRAADSVDGTLAGGSLSPGKCNNSETSKKK